ncbi:hypothetical protein O181_018214 [Austropuccinia psidii MF-1]|uniref:Secreted protein n=1 Tax=Austropuccinia psidii MF-1 TaxID=1389203 RepID=A0A9Q3C4V7_9BASI|nr:hypothetical protein [Austropuccinia psidii MF-1]
MPFIRFIAYLSLALTTHWKIVQVAGSPIGSNSLAKYSVSGECPCMTCLRHQEEHARRGGRYDIDMAHHMPLEPQYKYESYKKYTLEGVNNCVSPEVSRSPIFSRS